MQVNYFTGWDVQLLLNWISKMKYDEFDRFSIIARLIVSYQMTWKSSQLMVCQVDVNTINAEVIQGN